MAMRDPEQKSAAEGPPPTEPPYVPIACGFHDRLEHWAVRREPVEVVWREGGVERSAMARIADVWAEAGADHLKLDTGAVVRLDRLVSVGGLPLPDRC